MVQTAPPVRNRHLVREMDRRRIRDLLLVGALVIVLLLPLLTYVWYHMEWIRVGYEMQRLKQEREAQVELNARLRLEKATLESLGRVEREARGKLGLVQSTGAVVYMEAGFGEPEGTGSGAAVSRLEDGAAGEGGAASGGEARR
jgi:cell division protein FtsL